MLRSALVACVLAPGLAAGCQRDEADEPEPPVQDVEDACASDVPVRLAAPPASWKPDGWDAYHQVKAAGSQLLHSWGSFEGGTVESYLIDRCGGPSQALALNVSMLAVDTPAGLRLYGSESSQVYLVDRLDEPGLDIPRVIGKVEPGAGQVMDRSQGRLSVRVVATDNAAIPAAGLGARTWSMYVHDGEPLAPLRRVFDDFIEVVRSGPDEPLLVLFDSGELRSIDLDTGEDVLVQDGVRFAQSAPDGRTYVWQELGDGVAEAVHLVDVESGAQRTIGVNDFVGASWGAGETWLAGEWRWSADGRHVGLIRPGATLGTVVRTDTGAAVEVPAHTAFFPVFPAGFHLTFDDAGERVDALWDPGSGDRLEFHRGEPDVVPAVWRVTDDAVYHVLESEGPAYTEAVPLWRTDRATGERREVAPRFSRYGARELPDGRILTYPDVGDARRDLLLIDPDAAQTAVLARGVNQGFHVDAERGVYYLDTLGERPGLWLAPIPPR